MGRKYQSGEEISIFEAKVYDSSAPGGSFRGGPFTIKAKRVIEMDNGCLKVIAEGCVAYYNLNNKSWRIYQ